MILLSHSLSEITRYKSGYNYLHSSSHFTTNQRNFFITQRKKKKRIPLKNPNDKTMAIQNLRLVVQYDLLPENKSNLQRIYLTFCKAQISSPPAHVQCSDWKSVSW